MRVALLIFRKDARRLRLELGAWALFLGIYGWMQAVGPARIAFLGIMEMWEVLLVPASWYLVVAAVHEERLPGERQDWLTKPIPRASLLLAKTLFLAVFLNLPLALLQMLALLVNGLSPIEYGRMLISRQLFFTAILIAPAAALAAVTATFAQFAVTLLTCYSAVLLLGLGAAALMAQEVRWGGIDWILITIVAALALFTSTAVLLLAYLLRKIGLARAVFGGGVMFSAALPAMSLWPASFRFQQRLSERPAEARALHLSFDAAREASPGGGVPVRSGPDFVRVAIPVRLQGMPACAELLSERIQTVVRAPGGISWRSGWRTAGMLLRRRDAWWQYLEIDRRLFDSLRDRDAHLHTRAALTLLGAAREARTPIPAENHFVPDVGFCWAVANRVLCLSPFQHAALIHIRSRSCLTGDLRELGIRPDISYAPYSTGFGFGIWNTDIDLMLFAPLSDCELVIETRDALAHFELDLDIPAIRLAAYQVSPGAVR